MREESRQSISCVAGVQFPMGLRAISASPIPCLRPLAAQARIACEDARDSEDGVEDKMERERERERESRRNRLRLLFNFLWD